MQRHDYHEVILSNTEDQTQIKHTVVATSKSINILTDKLYISKSVAPIPNKPCFRCPADFPVHSPNSKSQNSEDFQKVKRFGEHQSIIAFAKHQLLPNKDSIEADEIDYAKIPPRVKSPISKKTMSYGTKTIDLNNVTSDEGKRQPQPVFFVGTTQSDRSDRRRAASAKTKNISIEPPTFLHRSSPYAEAAYMEFIRDRCNESNMRPYLSAFELMKFRQGTLSQNRTVYQNIKF